MNSDGRTMAEAMKNVFNDNILTYNNILAFVDAFYYGTASAVIPLVKDLKTIYSLVNKGKVIRYTDSDNFVKTLDKDNFDEFVLNFFNEFILNEIYSDDRIYYDKPSLLERLFKTLFC